MKTAIYMTLDRRHRVVEWNFWFQPQHLAAGAWRNSTTAVRKRDVAISLVNTAAQVAAAFRGPRG